MKVVHKMKNTKTNKLQLPLVDIRDDIGLEDVTIINPIGTLSKEENEEIIKSCIEGLKALKNPDRWMTWEESDRILTEKYFSGNV